TYYAGMSAVGTPLPGAPSLAGMYTVVASFASSTDYTPASAQATFSITLSISGHRYVDVTGNGLSADDAALAGAALTLYRDTDADGALNTAVDSAVATLTTDPTGAFSFLGLSTATYFVQETVPSGYVQTSPVSGYRTVPLSE